MRVTERTPGDIAELMRRARVEKDALVRDRYRAVLMALDGLDCPGIVKALGRSRRSVQDWVYCYRDEGIDALLTGEHSGRPPKLPREREEQLRARLDAGPRPELDGGVCTLRGKDVVRILDTEFGVKHTLGSIYGVLDRLGYSCLKPRPRHEKNDPAAAEAFKQQAPLLSRP